MSANPFGIGIHQLKKSTQHGSVYRLKKFD